MLIIQPENQRNTLQKFIFFKKINKILTQINNS